MDSTSSIPNDNRRYYSLKVVARDFYPTSLHTATVTRHILRGAKLKDGSFRKLAALRTPGEWLVTREAVNEFLAAITADHYQS